MNSFSLILLISLSFAIFHLVPANDGKNVENNPIEHHTETETKNKEDGDGDKPRAPPAAHFQNYKPPKVTHFNTVDKKEEPQSPKNKLEKNNSQNKMEKSNSNKHLEKSSSLSKKHKTLQEHFIEEPLNKPEQEKVNEHEHAKVKGGKPNALLKSASKILKMGKGLLPLATRETENDLETNAVTEMESDPEHPSHTAITAFLTSNKLKQDLKATKARLSEVDEFGRNTNALTNHLVNVVDNEKKYNDKQHGIHRDNQGILKAQGDQNEMDIGELRVDHEGLVAKHENLDGRFNQHEQVNANEHGEMVKGIRKNEGGIVKLNEEVTSQDARLTVNEAGLDDLGKKHGNLEKTVEGHGGRLGEAERRIGVHDTEITGLHETDTTLGGRIEGAEKEHRRFVNDEFVPHVQNVNGKFETVGKDISGLDGRTKELGRVQGEHGTSIFNLETNLGNEERDRIRGDDMLSQKIIDETTPIRDQANRVEASLGQTIDKVDKNTGMLGTHGEKLDSHHGRLSSAERRLGENDGKFVRHVNRIKKRKHDILTIRQRFVQLYGNMDKLAEMQQNIDGSMMSMEEEFASNLAQGQERVVEANKALAEANQQVVQTIENYVRSLRHSQKSDGPIGQMHDERAQLIRAQFKLLDEEEKERVQRQLAKITNTQGESQAVETE